LERRFVLSPCARSTETSTGTAKTNPAPTGPALGAPVGYSENSVAVDAATDTIYLANGDNPTDVATGDTGSEIAAVPELHGALLSRRL
jgi:hypothetical protein